MACKCLEKILKQTVEAEQQQNKNWTISDAEFLNKGWNLSSKGNPVNLYHTVKIEYTFTKVNGDISTPKSEKVSVYGNYCMFCGKKFIEEEEGGSNDGL